MHAKNRKQLYDYEESTTRSENKYEKDINFAAPDSQLASHPHQPLTSNMAEEATPCKCIHTSL
jgi:hypothetical protein